MVWVRVLAKLVYNRATMVVSVRVLAMADTRAVPVAALFCKAATREVSALAPAMAISDPSVSTKMVWDLVLAMAARVDRVLVEPVRVAPLAV